MHDDPEVDDPHSAAIEGRLRTLPEITPPPDLLGRCLATVPEPVRPLRRNALRFAAAAAMLLGVAAWLGRGVEADAAAQLKAVKTAWSEVPSSHRVARIATADGPRTEESWFVRGKGRRTEVRSGDDRISVTVDNGRWQLRLDERTRLLVAWSTALSVIPMGDGGMEIDGEAFLKWAEDHRGQIRVEREALGGADTRKIAVRWPGPTEGAAVPRETTYWFDPDTHRPLKQRVDFGDGRSSEVVIDYPQPSAVPSDLFDLRPSPGTAIEINDPDLGRQVYSPGTNRGDDR